MSGRVILNPFPPNIANKIGKKLNNKTSRYGAKLKEPTSIIAGIAIETKNSLTQGESFSVLELLIGTARGDVLLGFLGSSLILLFVF